LRDLKPSYVVFVRRFQIVMGRQRTLAAYEPRTRDEDVAVGGLRDAEEERKASRAQEDRVGSQVQLRLPTLVIYRTGSETGDVQAVMDDGEIDQFIKAYLMEYA